MARSIHRRYVDPLDAVWLEAARGIGFEVIRTEDAFASSDGARRIAIATAEHLDPDDCLAQMIFHELCHSLVEGEDSFASPDWGLHPSGQDVEREHACLRTQAHLAARFGLRRVLAPTTEFRDFYDRLDPDPLEPRSAPSSSLAALALRRAATPPWAPHLQRAMERTRAIAILAAPAAAPGDLLADLEPAPEPHPTGLPGGFVAGRRCGDCVWVESGRCRQAGAPVRAEWAACARFEAALECLECAACCREAYHSVTVEADDPVVDRHPELIVDRGEYLELRRRGEGDASRCAALQKDWRCAIYPRRPTCCREFEAGGEHCLTARRRVGLSL